MTFNAAGRVRVVDVATAPVFDGRVGALSFDPTGALIYSTNASPPDSVCNNWPFVPSGAVKFNITDTPLADKATQQSVTHANGASQQIWATLNNAIAGYSQGLPFDVNGNLCVGTGAPAGRAFSNGFSEGFS